MDFVDSEYIHFFLDVYPYPPPLYTDVCDGSTHIYKELFPTYPHPTSKGDGFVKSLPRAQNSLLPHA